MRQKGRIYGLSNKMTCERIGMRTPEMIKPSAIKAYLLMVSRMDLNSSAIYSLCVGTALLLSGWVLSDCCQLPCECLMPCNGWMLVDVIYDQHVDFLAVDCA